MVRADTDICDSQELFLVAHTKVAEIRREPYENKFNRNSVVVSVDDSGVWIDIGFPTASLEINSKGVRRDVTEDFVLGKLTGDENHG